MTMGVWVVLRVADTGEAEVYAAFTDQVLAEDIADRISADEGPAYHAFVEYVQVDFDPEGA